MRYRLLRFFMRGPLVAIFVILAIEVVPKVESVLGLPRDVILFGVITTVIIFSQLILSVTKGLVDRLIYREDRDEIAWLREVDRRLLTTSDLRQLLENNLVALCELLRVPDAFVAAAIGPDLILEAVVGQPSHPRPGPGRPTTGQKASAGPCEHRRRNCPLTTMASGSGLWPRAAMRRTRRVFGLLGVRHRADATALTKLEQEVHGHDPGAHYPWPWRTGSCSRACLLPCAT